MGYLCYAILTVIAILASGARCTSGAAGVTNTTALTPVSLRATGGRRRLGRSGTGLQGRGAGGWLGSRAGNRRW